MVSSEQWTVKAQEIERYTRRGHDRDSAEAMLSQALNRRALDDIQVLHLLRIGYSAGYEAAIAKVRAEGLLVEPGGETRVEWGAESPSGTAHMLANAERDRTREDVEVSVSLNPGWRLVSRTVHTGPWQPTDTKEPSP